MPVGVLLIFFAGNIRRDCERPEGRLGLGVERLE